MTLIIINWLNVDDGWLSLSKTQRENVVNDVKERIWRKNMLECMSYYAWSMMTVVVPSQGPEERNNIREHARTL